MTLCGFDKTTVSGRSWTAVGTRALLVVGTLALCVYCSTTWKIGYVFTSTYQPSQRNGSVADALPNVAIDTIVIGAQREGVMQEPEPRYHDNASSVISPEFPISVNIPNVSNGGASRSPLWQRNQSSLSQALDSDSGQIQVLLVTFYRGGSSFFGELFNQNPSCEYWFEPLRGLYVRRKPSLHLFGEGDSYGVNNASLEYLPETYQREVVGEISSLFGCNFSQVPDFLISDPFTVRTVFNRQVIGAANCSRRRGMSDMALCKQKLTSACTNASIIATKVIRIGLYMLTNFLELHPRAKLIYYVRDPRGIVHSRYKIHRTFSYLKRDTPMICRTLEDNYHVFQKLRLSHPDRVLMVRFEDLALQPNQTAQQVYSFLRVEPHAHLLDWLAANTVKASNEPYGTARVSKDIPYRWKTELPRIAQEEVNRLCETAIKLYDY